MDLNDDLLGRSIYVNEYGAVTCNDLLCDCEGDILAGLGRRVTMRELIEHMIAHWEA